MTYNQITNFAHHQVINTCKVILKYEKKKKIIDDEHKKHNPSRTSTPQLDDHSSLCPVFQHVNCSVGQLQWHFDNG
jgi:hypothetical protein